MTDIVATTASVDTTSLMSIDYYRQKVIEFQQVLMDLDTTYSNLIQAQQIAYDLGDPDMINDADSLLTTLRDKLSSFRTVAQGIQLASNGINAVGVDFPTVQIPGGLGFVPLVPLAAAAAVITSAVALIYWAKGFWQTVSDFALRYQTVQAIQALPQDQQAAAIATMQTLNSQVNKARASADASPLSSLADMGKWIILAGLLYVGYKMIKDK